MPDGKEVHEPENYCCDNGNFGEPHECQKQPGATPAPSQPAGAREWLNAHRKEMFALACAFDEARLAELMDAFLTERIATLTDKLCRMQDDIATIVSTHRADWSWNDVVADVKGLAQQTAAKDAALVAAERERDSLREAVLDEVIDEIKHVVADDVLALVAALKAGKEPDAT